MTGNDRSGLNYFGLAALAALLTIATPAAGASQAGSWTYEVSRNDGHELMFTEEGRSPSSSDAAAASS